MRRQLHPLLTLILLLYLATACSNETPPASLPARLDSFLANATKARTFSGSVLIARNDQILLQQGYGSSHTPNTRFQIGSLTKQFTAMTMLILQERGLLHVQDHVCNYLPTCPTSWQAITLHHLLTHSSAIPQPTSSSPTPITSPEQLLSFYQRAPLSFVPGTRFAYSNEGYQVLGYVIQHVSHLSYTEAVQQNILTVLHMHATSFVAQDADEAGPAWAFTLAAGGLSSTVGDLYRWDQALSTTTLVSQKTLQTIMTPFIVSCTTGCPTRFQHTHYGYGWYISQETRRLVLWHTGVADGYGAYNSYYPTTHVSIIILTDDASIFTTPYGFTLSGTLEDLIFSTTS